MSSERGKLIVFEGVGGCGKGTQVELLRQALTEKGKKVLVTCEHTRDTPIGRLIEETIKKKKEGMDPDALQVAFISDRINHTNRVIVPALESHDFVLVDVMRLQLLVMGKLIKTGGIDFQISSGN